MGKGNLSWRVCATPCSRRMAIRGYVEWMYLPSSLVALLFVSSCCRRRLAKGRDVLRKLNQCFGSLWSAFFLY